MTTFKLTGRIGNDAKKTTFDSGKTLIEFSIAENYFYYNNKEKVEATEWHDCRLWRSTENEMISKHLTKGALVTVSGDVRYYQFKDLNGYLVRKPHILVSEIKIHSKSKGE